MLQHSCSGWCLVQPCGAAAGAGAAGVQHGPHLLECGHTAHGAGVWLAGNSAGADMAKETQKTSGSSGG